MQEAKDFLVSELINFNWPLLVSTNSFKIPTLYSSPLGTDIVTFLFSDITHIIISYFFYQSIGNFNAQEWDFWVFVEIPRVISGIYHKHYE